MGENREKEWLRQQLAGRHRVMLLGGLAAVLLPGCGGDPLASMQRAEGRITAESLLSDTQFLSSDEMEGRATGTAGEARAARFIAGEFARVGLRPLPWDGSASVGFQPEDYFHPVRLVGMKKVAESSRLEVRNEEGSLSLIPAESVAFWSAAQEPSVRISAAPLIFVGYGVEAPEHDWDDFKGADLKGKVLLFLNNDPPVEEGGVELFGGPARTYYGRWTYKFEQAMRQGAAGALMIHTTESASYPFSVVRGAGVLEGFALDLPGSGYQVDLLGWIAREPSEEIARSMGKTLEDLFSMAARRDFAPLDTGYRVTAQIETTVRPLESHNVVGMLEGSDSVLKDQLIVFSAHYDHLGAKSGAEGEDVTFNGAWDNASGTACLLNLARAFAALEQRPRRSVAFLACTAEEKGLLGSRWFVEQPPVELRRIVANYNIDMPQIFGVTSDIAAIGHDASSLGEDLRRVVGNLSPKLPYTLHVVGDPHPEAGHFYRSDQVNFARRGIPALYLRPGNRYIRPPAVDPTEYHTRHYHQVSDEVNESWDLSGAERDVRLFFRSALSVATRDEPPRWKKGNEFEAAWKRLYDSN